MARIKTIADRIMWATYPILLLSALSFFAPQISLVAGTMFPVLDPTLKITSARLEQTTDGPVTVVSGSAYKVRGRCSYVNGSLRWYLGSPGGLREVVPSEFRDAPTLRTSGRTEWTGIVVGLFPVQVQTISYATVQHQCPWFPIPITSYFYVPENSIQESDK